ncbi:MAG: ACT domain-containing protein [Saprospiraceae bacterium]|jgi:hypothetical protein|nr:ACT domain-containing protein [Saprospiraceae bacterium]
MNKETSELENLISNMNPILNDADYVFCAVSDISGIDLNSIVMQFKEKEGLTLIISKSEADKLGLVYEYVASWITLSVQSQLTAVGFTSAFSKVLSDQNISCNVVAALHHDHIFVNKSDAARAMEALRKFQIKQ